MPRSVLAATLAGAVACSGIAEQRSQQAERGLRGSRAPYHVPPSGDRGNPQRIVLDPDGRGQARGAAPSPGTWWYVVVSDARATPGAFRFTATHEGSPGLLELALVTDRGELAATAVSDDPNKVRLELPYTPEPPPRFLLRVRTTTALKFHLFATRGER